MSEEAVAGASVSQAPSRARLAALLVLVVLLPLLALAWVAASGVGRSETRKADLRLESEGRLASAVFVRSVAEAATRAGTLASSPALQQALAARDRPRLRRLTKPHDVVVAGGQVLAGRREPLAVHRSVSVVVGGRPVGSVTVNVPLNAALLRRVRSEVALDSRDRFALRRDGRAIAGAISSAAAVPIGRSIDRNLGGTKYRLFAVRLVGPPDDVKLLALTPRSEIGGSVRDRLFWSLLAVVVTLATVAVTGYALAPVLARRAGALPVIRDRRDARAFALVGDALASTHNPDQLLPVILHATMDATGANGGRVVQDGRVRAEEGDVAGAAHPLRLDLGVEGAAGESALELWPASGSFDARTRALARSLAAQAAIALENARLHAVVQQQAITDELTELANRRRFMERLDTELRRAERFDEPLALVFADLDDFKRVNDLYGHHVGDSVLRAFADVIRGRVRAIDLAARLGGEEFAILLIETDLNGAEALAENLRSAVASMEVRIGGRPPVRITASFGVSDYPSARGAEDLMAAADLALYQAKRERKNTVRASLRPPV
ncbi:MAG TPA: GGDEF domain-containing protein [Gaiellaceae bacterium]